MLTNSLTFARLLVLPRQNNIKFQTGKYSMNLFSEGKRNLVAKTLMDCAKVILASLFAANFFVQFEMKLRITVWTFMFAIFILGWLLCSDKREG